MLAVGEQAGSTGREMLAAFILGYDVVGRLAGGFTPRPLAHQNGQVSLLAAAAAGASLRGLDAAGISRAMRIATTLLLTPSYTNAVAGATALNVAGGMSGFAGALAPDLALAGFEAQDDAIEEALGQAGRRRFHARTACSTSLARAGRSRATISGSTPAATRSTRRSTASRRRSPNCGRAPEQIERIEVATYRFASVMRNPDPPNYFASKYSLPHAAAAMVVRGGAGFAAARRQRP